ncbi:MAG: dCTP deaminase domain-containing protein [Candidatus Nitrosocaldus sp.]
MAVIGKDELTKLIERYKCIHPFNPMLLDGDGYILTVKADVTLNYLEHKNVISHEVVFTPPNYVAHLTAKSRYGRLGLSFLNAAKVHSGFVGRIVLEVVNLNNERKPITIRRGDPFMHIEFIERIGKPSPYEGEYQFQYMSGDEVKMYISVLREFDSVFNIEMLERIASRRVT